MKLRSSRRRVLALVLPLALALCGNAAAPSPASKPLLVALGDSITAGVNGGNYVTLLADTLDAQPIDLGVPGEFSGAVNYQISAGALIRHGGVLVDEVPKIPSTAAIVTLYIGTNDMWLTRIRGVRDAGALEVLTAKTALDYAENLRAIAAAIRARAPRALLVIADVPNYANRPSELPEGTRIRTAETLLADAVKAAVVSTGAVVVDLECDPAMYDDRNYETAYDVHPSLQGFRAIAADFARAIAQKPAPAACRYEGQI